MRLKSIIASAFTALMVACPVLAFSESADFDDSVPDTDETMTIDTPASNADSNDSSFAMPWCCKSFSLQPSFPSDFL